MHTLTRKRVAKFSKDFGLESNESENFEHYVAWTYLHRYTADDIELITRSVLGGGDDEGIDIAAIAINGQLVFEPQDIDELIAEQTNNSVKLILIQAKTSEKYDTKLIAKFLHGVESVSKVAIQPNSIPLSPRLKDLAAMLDRITENMDKFSESRIPCDLYYVTTSSNDGSAARDELQVKQAMHRINELGMYNQGLEIRTNGFEELATKQKERLGPQNVRFAFEKRQTIPSTDKVVEAYTGLVSADQLLNLLLDDGEVRAGIFDDNVRLDLGTGNPVNQRIMETLVSSSRELFPYLNNGLTIIATKLQGTGDKFYLSGYQIVNGAQTSHQIVRWSQSEAVLRDPGILRDLWVPVKIVGATDAEVRSAVAVATNLQSAIGNVDIQASSQRAKDVEEYFAQTGAEGLRYERQSRGRPLDFARTRVVGTSELNRAVASSLFGESARAIGTPKDLESKDSFVWGDYPVEIYYYAAWIIYRVDRYFARTPDAAVLRAAKYSIAAMASARVNPALIPLFESVDNSTAARLLRDKRLKLSVSRSELQQDLERAIEFAVTEVKLYFSTVLAEGRSLRKDDVRNRRHQDALLEVVKTANAQHFRG